MDSDNSKFKKILWILVLIPICIIGVIIFGRKIVTPSNEEIIENLHNVKNYSCNVQYKFINSKSEYSENTKQYYSADNGMRIEFQDEDGRVKVYKGSEIQIKDENNKEYTIDKNIDEIYPLAFMCNILDDKMYGQLEVINSEWSDDEYIRVTIDYPSGNKHLDKAEFYEIGRASCRERV